MIKTMDILALGKEADKEKIWKFWNEKRAPKQALQPSIIRYYISRVSIVHRSGSELDKVIGDDGTARGIWGMEEIWYDMDPQSFAAYRASLEAIPEVKKENEEWYKRFDWYTTLLLEERPMLDRMIVDNDVRGIKTLAFHEPKKGLNTDDIWKFWIETHGPRHVFPNDTPAIRRYSISRVKEVLAGDPHGVWGIAELWQADPSVESRAARMAARGGGGPQPWVYEWHSKFSWSPTVWLEEKRIVDEMGPGPQIPNPARK